MSSQYDSLVFVVVVRCLFVFEQFERAKYIRSETRNQINSCQYVANWSQRYYSHNSNIKFVDSTITCTDFESFHYAINLDYVSSFVVFSDFGSILLIAS